MLVRIPRGRFLEVEEAAAMAAWLVSQDNSFITASVFDLSGSRAIYQVGATNALPDPARPSLRQTG